MGANNPRRRSEFVPHGHDWQDLCRPSLNIAIYIYAK